MQSILHIQRPPHRASSTQSILHTQHPPHRASSTQSILHTQHPLQPGPGQGFSLVLPQASVQAGTSLTAAICSGTRATALVGLQELPSLLSRSWVLRPQPCTFPAVVSGRSPSSFHHCLHQGKPPAARLSFYCTSFKPGLAGKQEFHLKKKKPRGLEIGFHHHFEDRVNC